VKKLIGEKNKVGKKVDENRKNNFLTLDFYLRLHKAYGVITVASVVSESINVIRKNFLRRLMSSSCPKIKF
jgi:hypothetical protein